VTIGAVIDAYGAGEIELKAVDRKTRKQDIHDLAGARSYTCMTVATFLNWLYKSEDTGETQPTRTCRIAFDAWHAQQQAGCSGCPRLNDRRARRCTGRRRGRGR